MGQSRGTWAASVLASRRSRLAGPQHAWMRVPAGWYVGVEDRGLMPRSCCVQVSWLVPSEDSSLASRLWLLL